MEPDIHHPSEWLYDACIEPVMLEIEDLEKSMIAVYWHFLNLKLWRKLTLEGKEYILHDNTKIRFIEKDKK